MEDNYDEIIQMNNESNWGENIDELKMLMEIKSFREQMLGKLKGSQKKRTVFSSHFGEEQSSYTLRRHMRRIVKRVIVLLKCAKLMKVDFDHRNLEISVFMDCIQERKRAIAKD
jgi:hypothetical protein